MAVQGPRAYADVNAVVGRVLRDLAFAQSSQQKRFGLQRRRCVTTDQLVYAETAIAHARLAGIPPDRIVNCWPLDRLLAWLRDPPRERLVPPTSAAQTATHPRGRCALHQHARQWTRFGPCRFRLRNLSRGDCERRSNDLETIRCADDFTAVTARTLQTCFRSDSSWGGRRGRRSGCRHHDGAAC